MCSCVSDIILSGWRVSLLYFHFICEVCCRCKQLHECDHCRQKNPDTLTERAQRAAKKKKTPAN